jgi:hypothetical protein
MKIACYDYEDEKTIKVFAFDDDTAQDILNAARGCETITDGSLVNGVLLYGHPAVVKLEICYDVFEHNDVIDELKNELGAMDIYLFASDVLKDNIV